MKHGRLRKTRLFRLLKVVKSIHVSLRTKISSDVFSLSFKRVPGIYSYLSLSNETGTNNDGTGAQVQRLMAVASLAETIGSPFVQQEIIDVAIHPLDPFQKRDQYDAYLLKLNQVFKITNIKDYPTTARSINVRNLKLRILLKYAFMSRLRRKSTLLVIDNPYSVSDLNVDAYKLLRPNLEVSKLIRNNKYSEPFIAIHYRQGVGGFVRYPGQSIPREMKIEYFRNEIHKFLTKSELQDAVVHIFTDAPPVQVEFVPPANQLYLWEGTPGYKDGVMQVQPLVFDAASLAVSRVEVHAGGDPLEAIIMMASASLLIMGRSSLSYVAGLLNEQGVVIPAPLFWHPPLSDWTGI